MQAAAQDHVGLPRLGAVPYTRRRVQVSSKYTNVMDTHNGNLLGKIILNQVIGVWDGKIWAMFRQIRVEFGQRFRRDLFSFYLSRDLGEAGKIYVLPPPPPPPPQKKVNNEEEIVFVISVVKKQYKTKWLVQLGLDKYVCYIRYLLYEISLYWISTVLLTSVMSFFQFYLYGGFACISYLQLFLNPSLVSVPNTQCE